MRRGWFYPRADSALKSDTSLRLIEQVCVYLVHLDTVSRARSVSERDCECSYFAESRLGQAVNSNGQLDLRLLLFSESTSQARSIAIRWRRSDNSRHS
jgi:hypothetical protein